MVPGYLPLDDPGEQVCSALRQAAARSARMVSMRTGAFALARRALRCPDRQGAMRWLAAARIREARPLLKATDLPVEVIAARCGLGTAANLRVHLARKAGATPTAYRAGSRLASRVKFIAAITSATCPARITAFGYLPNGGPELPGRCLPSVTPTSADDQKTPADDCEACREDQPRNKD